MDDNKTLTWQYIGIIACVCILLTLAVISSFAFAISPNVNTKGVAQAYTPNDDIYSYNIDGDWTFDLSPTLQITELNMLYFRRDIYPYLPDTFSNGVQKSEISIIGYSFYADLEVYSDFGDGGYDELRVYDYPSLDSTAPQLNDFITGDEAGSYTFFINVISTDLSIAYQLYNQDTPITRSYYLQVSSIRIIYSADYSMIDPLVEGAYDRGFDAGYDLGYDEGYDVGDREGYDIGFDEGSVIGYDEGYDNGFYQGRLDGISTAGDGDWMNIVSALFDAPINILFGALQDTNNDGVVDTRVGGLLDFYIPWLNLDVSSVFISLISLLIIVIVARFVLGLIM